MCNTYVPLEKKAASNDDKVAAADVLSRNKEIKCKISVIVSMLNR